MRPAIGRVNVMTKAYTTKKNELILTKWIVLAYEDKNDNTDEYEKPIKKPMPAMNNALRSIKLSNVIWRNSALRSGVKAKLWIGKSNVAIVVNKINTDDTITMKRKFVRFNKIIPTNGPIAAANDVLNP